MTGSLGGPLDETLAEALVMVKGIDASLALLGKRLSNLRRHEVASAWRSAVESELLGVHRRYTDARAELRKIVDLMDAAIGEAELSR